MGEPMTLVEMVDGSMRRYGPDKIVTSAEDTGELIVQAPADRYAIVEYVNRHQWVVIHNVHQCSDCSGGGMVAPASECQSCAGTGIVESDLL